MTYLQRIALSPDAVITVSLQDVFRADAAATVIGSQVQAAGGRQVPIAFEVGYDPAKIDQRLTYTVSATIQEPGKVTWRSPQAYKVITGGVPTTGVPITVEQVP